MGGDVIAFIAFYFVLRIVFRGVMYIAFIAKIFAVDGDNSARHPARFGTPAYMIANLELLSHRSRLLTRSRNFSSPPIGKPPKRIPCYDSKLDMKDGWS